MQNDVNVDIRCSQKKIYALKLNALFMGLFSSSQFLILTLKPLSYVSVWTFVGILLMAVGMLLSFFFTLIQLRIELKILKINEQLFHDLKK